ncbi:hypothetical protein TSUD_267470 [Trifolium subterraneum]|uniref:Uncharacterized protein n=1 Tax=Trifolium subterraneum TaxID=3900 RepID=A0A2Z6NLU9_TRISU|nr:hypothetical protein TSUD_267470 [Trifolium subterraneum]
MFGRVKVVCDPKTKKMDFFMENCVNGSELQWAPIILNQHDKQDVGSSSNVQSMEEVPLSQPQFCLKLLDKSAICLSGPGTGCLNVTTVTSYQSCLLES